MNTTIESILNEVAKNHGCGDYENWKEHTGLHAFTDQLMNEAMELYHLRKCGETGRALPTQSDAILQAPLDSEGYNGFLQCHEWFYNKASKLLASKESQLLQLGMDGQVMQGEHEQIVESLNSKLEAKDKEIRKNISSWERCLKVLEKTSDDLVECRKELQKSKAEAGRLKENIYEAIKYGVVSAREHLSIEQRVEIFTKDKTEGK